MELSLETLNFLLMVCKATQLNSGADDYEEAAERMLTARRELAAAIGGQSNGDGS